VKTFDIKVQKEAVPEGWVRVDLSGFLDAHTVREFDASKAELLRSASCNILLVLEKLNYISSAGVASLMGLMQKLRGGKGRLVLLRPSDKVFHVLKTLGFTNIFQIVQDDSELDTHEP